LKRRVVAKTRNRIPAIDVASAIWRTPEKYKIPDSRRSVMASNSSFKSFAIYLSLAVSIILIVYYVPDYYFLESTIAIHSSTILSFFGLEAPLRFFDGLALVGNYAVVKDCTGVQVMAVFLGLLLPLPGVSWLRKVLSLVLLGGLLYTANVFRVVLEYYLVDAKILPWSLAHYPLSLVLGIVGVFFLVLVNNKVIPEFGEYFFSMTKRVEGLLKRR
jgi:exosortase/archaeosortase family protein